MARTPLAAIHAHTAAFNSQDGDALLATIHFPLVHFGADGQTHVGAVPLDADARPLSPDALREIGTYLDAQRAAQGTSDAPFDLVVARNTVGQDLAAAAETIAPYAPVGLDWWVETAFDFETLDGLVRRGPPA